MTAIIDQNGNIQLNTPYQTIEDLIAYGLSDWRFATDDEVSSYQAQQSQNQLNALLPLYQAENDFITYARSLNLEDKATMTDFQNAATSAETQALSTIQSGDMANGMAQFSQAVKIPLMALALINDITQAGGDWNNISWHDNLPNS